MAKVNGKTVTVVRDAGNHNVAVRYDDGKEGIVPRSDVTDYNWQDLPAASVKPPPVNPAYRNPHHPADYIPEEPDPNYKDPNAQDMTEPKGETPEQTKERHQNNPNRNPNDPPIDPAIAKVIEDQQARLDQDDARAGRHIETQVDTDRKAKTKANIEAAKAVGTSATKASVDAAASEVDRKAKVAADAEADFPKSTKGQDLAEADRIAKAKADADMTSRHKSEVERAKVAAKTTATAAPWLSDKGEADRKAKAEADKVAALQPKPPFKPFK